MQMHYYFCVGLAFATTLVACAAMRVDSDDLHGRWRVVEVSGTAPVARTEPGIDLAPDGRISGSSGCNYFAGQYSIEGDRFNVTDLEMTLVACGEGERANLIAQQEQAVLAALGSGGTLVTDGPLLMLRGDDGGELRFERAQ